MTAPDVLRRSLEVSDDLVNNYRKLVDEQKLLRSRVASASLELRRLTEELAGIDSKVTDAARAIANRAAFPIKEADQ